MFDFAGFNSEAEGRHCKQDEAEGCEKLGVGERDVYIDCEESDNEDCGEVADESAFDKPNLVDVRLVINAVGDGVWYGERVVGEFQRWR